MGVLITGLMMVLTSATASGDTSASATVATGLSKPTDGQLGFVALLDLIAHGARSKKKLDATEEDVRSAREAHRKYIQDLDSSDLGSVEVGGYEGVTANGSGYSAVAKTQ
jgi:hypothetical protein